MKTLGEITDQVEKWKSDSATLEQVTAQRDELLAALRNCESHIILHCCKVRSINGEQWESTDQITSSVLQGARMAIANADGLSKTEGKGI